MLLPLALCAKDYYKILGIDKQASEKEIKRAYRNLSKKHHPDKNPGDESAHKKFVELAEAYDALSNIETRRIYDRYGREGLEQHRRGGGAAPHRDPFDLFSRFFGGGGHFGHGGAQRQGPSSEVNMHIPLRDFYTGKETEFSVERQIICEHCEGSGSADGLMDSCSQCGGSGRTVDKHQIAPGVFQHIQRYCGTCGGMGKKIRNACSVCHGSKVVRKSSTFTMEVERGMPKGIRVNYENEGDESPDWVAGDLIVQVLEKDPEVGATEDERTDGTFFRRKGDDLFWTEVLSLREAWMGEWTRNITHLDGHVVRLSRPRGEVVQPHAIEVIKGEGMPLWTQGGGNAGHSDSRFGALHVEYIVVLPDQMDKSMEKDFWTVWQKWRGQKGAVADLDRDSGRPPPSAAADKAKAKDEL